MNTFLNYKRYKFNFIFIRTVLLNIILLGSSHAPSKPVSGIVSNKLKSQTKQYKEISMINLIATPEKYNNTRVRIVGYLNLEFENDAIYLHKEDCDLKISKNCIGVELIRPLSNHYRECNKKYVFVEDVFNMNRANQGSFNSSIININRLEIN